MTTRSRIDPRDAVMGALITVIATVIFVVAASMDPEPYHDGSQLPAAIAVSEGLIVHRDVFSGYGFITAWIQGAAVGVFGPYLIVIRLLSAVVLAISALLLFVLGRWSLGNRWISAGVALTWVVTWPGQAVTWGTPLFPWPSTFFLMFQLFVVLLTARALLHAHHRSMMLALAGFALGIAVLTRLNYGAALALALLLTMLVLARSVSLRPRDFAIAMGSTVLSFALFVGVITWQGAFPSFLDQSILGPLQGKAIVKPTEWFYIENGYLWGSLLLILVVLFLVWISQQPWVSKRSLAVLTGLAVVGLTLWASTAIPGTPIRDIILSRLTWAPALDIQAMQPLYVSAVLTILTFIGFAAVSLVLRIRGVALQGTPNQVFMVLLASTGAASLVQLFPVADPNHLWWAAPLPLLLVVFVFTLNRAPRTRYAVSAVLLLPPLIISLPTAYVFLDRSRVQIDTGTLQGMWVSQEYRDAYRAVDQVLANIPPRSAHFDCHEGLFSVWNGTFLSATARYVDYAYGLDNTRPLGAVTHLVNCMNTGEPDTTGKLQVPPGFVFKDGRDAIRLSYFSDLSVSLCAKAESE